MFLVLQPNREVQQQREAAHKCILKCSSSSKLQSTGTFKCIKGPDFNLTAADDHRYMEMSVRKANFTGHIGGLIM